MGVDPWHLFCLVVAHLLAERNLNAENNVHHIYGHPDDCNTGFCACHGRSWQ